MRDALANKLICVMWAIVFVGGDTYLFLYNRHVLHIRLLDAKWHTENENDSGARSSGALYFYIDSVDVAGWCVPSGFRSPSSSSSCDVCECGRV